MKNKINILAVFLFFLIGNLFLISGISIIDVSSFPQEVVPGETVEVSIKIKNTFEDDVFNLNVKLDLEEAPFAPYRSSSEKFTDELEENDKKDFNFNLIVLPGTASGIYKIPVEISYEDEDENTSTKEELISIIVNSVPELKVGLVSDTLIKGKENTFSIRVINSGLANVKFVYLRVNDFSGLRFLSEKEQYIGDLESDDSDSIEYNVFINENSQNIINLPVTLKFRDITNKEFIENKNLVIRVYSLKEAQKLGLVEKPNYFIYIGAGILILGYIIYRIRKKRKSKLNKRI